MKQKVIIATFLISCTSAIASEKVLQEPVAHTRRNSWPDLLARPIGIDTYGDLSGDRARTQMQQLAWQKKEAQQVVQFERERKIISGIGTFAFLASLAVVSYGLFAANT